MEKHLFLFYFKPSSLLTQSWYNGNKTKSDFTTVKRSRQVIFPKTSVFKSEATSCKLIVEVGYQNPKFQREA